MNTHIHTDVHTHTHTHTHTHKKSTSLDPHLDIFSSCHELDFDTNECVPSCQFLPRAFECSLAMNSACCFGFFFQVPTVCKSVFVCSRISWTACTLLHILQENFQALLCCLASGKESAPELNSSDCLKPDGLPFLLPPILMDLFFLSSVFNAHTFTACPGFDPSSL